MSCWVCPGLSVRLTVRASWRYSLGPCPCDLIDLSSYLFEKKLATLPMQHYQCSIKVEGSGFP